MPLTDYLILVPLDEEWRTSSTILRPLDSPDITDSANNTMTYHLWKYPVPQDPLHGRMTEGDYLIAGVSMSLKTPGQSHSAVISNQAISWWHPYRVVMMGIAGSIEPDKLLLGDVVVSDNIFGYEVSDAEDTLKFRRTVHRTEAIGLDRVRTFLNDSKRYLVWQAECLEAGKALHQLPEQYLHPPVLHIRNTASGNSVVKSKEFAAGLKKQLDDSIAAVEMEATGLFSAIYLDDQCKNALMIRGISDYADEDKKQLDKRSHDTVRAWAAGNAARLLRAIWQMVPFSPISPAYQLDLAVGDQTRTRPNGQITPIEYSQAGAQNLSFPNLLQRRTPTPKILLNVQVEKLAGTPPAIRGLCIIDGNANTPVTGNPATGGGIFFVIPASENGVHVELLLSGETAADSIHIQCSDLFQRITKGTITFKQRI